MSASFPYFAVAQQLSAPYSEVLVIADILDKIGPFDPVGSERLLYCHVENAWLIEQTRRKAMTVEMEARKKAALKMGLIKDPDGLKLPDELWQQFL